MDSCAYTKRSLEGTAFKSDRLLAQMQINKQKTWNNVTALDCTSIQTTKTIRVELNQKRKEKNIMKKSVDLYEFRETFQSFRPDNFSYRGLSALFDYFEELESDIGEEIEFDCIAICCDFSEHESAIACIEEHGYSLEFDDDDDDDDEKEEKALEYLRGNTLVIPFENGIIIQAF